jgi:hypothetical protein
MGRQRRIFWDCLAHKLAIEENVQELNSEFIHLEKAEVRDLVVSLV